MRGDPAGAGDGPAASPAVTSARRLRPRSMPRNSATNASRGAARMRSGVSYCISRPSFIRASRSPMRIASSMSWVTRMMVLRSRRRIARNSLCSRSRTIGSTAPKGSSISITGGSAASARATPTRWRWPPESSRGIAPQELPRLEPDERQHLLDARRDPRLRPAEQGRHRRDVLGDAHVREQPDLLDDVADACGAGAPGRCRRRPRRRRGCGRRSARSGG